MTILDALSSLKAAAATVSGLEVFDLNQTVIPPAVVFGLPTLTAETFHGMTNMSGITEAQFECYLIASAGDGFAVENLLGNLNALLVAIESQTIGTVSAITPGVFTLDTGPQLPSYSLTIDYPLNGT